MRSLSDTSNEPWWHCTWTTERTLRRHGIRIPEDVSVASFVNKGHLPIWDQSLTRLEMDPITHGAALAKAVRTYLHGKPFPDGIVLGTVWKVGDTF